MKSITLRTAFFLLALACASARTSANQLLPEFDDQSTNSFWQKVFNEFRPRLEAAIESQDLAAIQSLYLTNGATAGEMEAELAHWRKLIGEKADDRVSLWFKELNTLPPEARESWTDYARHLTTRETTHLVFMSFSSLPSSVRAGFPLLRVGDQLWIVLSDQRGTPPDTKPNASIGASPSAGSSTNETPPAPNPERERSFQSSVPAQTFEVQGTLHYEAYQPDRTELAVTKEFKVQVKGCDWLIRTSEPGSCSYVEAGFRQGNLYNFTMWCSNTIGRSSNAYVGLIEADELPDDNGSQINYLWLAYASTGYLNHETGGALRPICCLDDRALRAEKFKMRSILTRADAEPRLPTWLAYLSDGYYRTVGADGRVVFKAPAPFDQGYTNAVYSVGALTNCGTLQLPLEFSFTRYAVSHDATKPGLWIRTRIVGKATTVVERLSSRVLLPQFSGAFRVKDNRFNSANPPLGQLHYEIRDGEWLNEANLAAAKLEASKQQDYREDAVRRAARSSPVTNSK
jgi:hypothetical protein